MAARDAADQSRRLALPKTGDEYKVEPTKDFKPPEGVEFSLDQKNPQVANLKAWALRNGVPQSELSGLVDIYGGLMVAQQQTHKAAFEAQVAALGTTGPARVDAVKTWLDAKGFGAFKPMIVTADIVKGFEKLMGDYRGGGGGGPNPRGTDNGAADGKIPGYEKMSFEQRRHAQEQRRSGAR